MNTIYTTHNRWYNVILAIAIAGVFFMFHPTQVDAHNETRVVKLSTDGFVPQTIEVDSNSAVIFLNEDTRDRWPASNTHPTHDIYPEFDPKRPLKPGESWSFKSTRAGTYKYHDHLYPHIRGTLVVKNETTSTKAAQELSTARASWPVDWLGGVGAWFSNLFEQVKNLFQVRPIISVDLSNISQKSAEEQIKLLQDFARAEGSVKAWQKFKELFKGQAGSSGNIHDLAHLSGKLLYEGLGFDGLANCSADFSFGCYHGFLDRAFRDNLDDLSEAESACLKIGREGSGPVASCVHGIGHGVASFYTTSRLEDSLTACRRLRPSGWEYCYDGVFMEFARGAAGSFYRQDRPLYPCDELEIKFGSQYSFSCGRNQPSVLMGRFKINLREVIKICLNSVSDPFKKACFDSVGFSMASSGDPDLISTQCLQIGVDEYIKRCLNAAAGELVFQEVPGWWQKSNQVCSSYSSSQKECSEHVQRLIRDYNRKISFNFEPKKPRESLDSYIRDNLKVCYSHDGRDSCYQDLAAVFYNQFGLATTLKELKTNEQYPEVYARCHEVTHYLSRLEYEKVKDISKVYSQCDSTCHGGCYHGTLEGYLQSKTQLPAFNLSSEFARICGSLGDYQQPIHYYECLHGLGHAAMFVTEMELPQSLTLCDTLGDQADKERCFTGVFMENSSSSTSFDHASRYIKPEDPFYPCNSLEERFQPLCWQYQSSYFSILSSQNWSKVADLCLQIPQRYQDRCFRAIGTNQVGFTTSLPQMKADCDLMPNWDFQSTCVEGVISSLAYRFVGDVQKMINFCNLVNTEHKERCFKQLGLSLKDWDRDPAVAQQGCSKIKDPQAADWCKSFLTTNFSAVTLN